MLTRNSISVFMLLAILVCNASSEISVIVYSKDEGLHEANISKPRIIIENTGTEPLSDFYYLYYFTAENGNTPVIEDYYTPDGSVFLQYLGHNRYVVRYDFPGVILYPGEVFPSSDGNVIGIHYPSWEPLCKGNDKSCNFSSEFVLNRNIPVFCHHNQINYESKTYHKHSTQKVHKRKPLQVSIEVDVDL